jgi:hypothetical protein
MEKTKTERERQRERAIKSGREFKHEYNGT